MSNQSKIEAKANDTEAKSDLYLNSSKDFRANKFEDFGYYFYPERFGNTLSTTKWYEKFLSSTGSSDTLNKAACEKNVQNALENRTFFIYFF
jgi:hypothetical protein